MELKSEPQYVEVKVTDLDIAFPGDLQTYTVKDGQDRLEFSGTQAILTFVGSGSVVFNLEHAHWYARRHRTIRVAVPPPAPAE